MITVSHFKHLLELRAGGQVTRYHTVRVNQRENNATHSHGVALLILAFWPDATRRLLMAALLHDLQELDTGDMPHTVKRNNSALNDALIVAEEHAAKRLGIHEVMQIITDDERAKLKVADVADAWHYGYEEYRSGNIDVGVQIMNNSLIAIARYPNAGTPYWWLHDAQVITARASTQHSARV